MKKIPQRMCVVTKEKTDKRNLLRIVKTKDNQILGGVIAGLCEQYDWNPAIGEFST